MISAQQIAMAAQAVPDYSPIAELAKSACMIGGYRDPYMQTLVAGIYMSAWQAKIAETQFMLLLGDLSHD